MSFSELKHYSNTFGPIYGTEDFGVYLYALIKMRKIATVLEYGTGLGVSAFWCAQAVKENGVGLVHTIDDGSDWPTNLLREELRDHRHLRHQEYVQKKAIELSVSTHLVIHEHKIDFAKRYTDAPIGLVFLDYDHGVVNLIKFMAAVLPKMETNGFIFIDGASCFLPTYWMFKDMLAVLNTGRVPAALLEHAEDELLLKEYVAKSHFTLTHNIERKDRKQNNTMCIQITDLDILPYDRIHIRI